MATGKAFALVLAYTPMDLLIPVLPGLYRISLFFRWLGHTLKKKKVYLYLRHYHKYSSSSFHTIKSKFKLGSSGHSLDRISKDIKCGKEHSNEFWVSCTSWSFPFV